MPTVRAAIHVTVPPRTVFETIDTAAGRERFWAESAAEADGAVTFVFINGTTHRGRLLRCEPPRLWSVDYFGSPATFTLSDDGNGGTDVVLTHVDVAAGEWAEVYAGWVSVLLALKAWLVLHVDIRNHDPARTWDHGFVDQ